MKRAMILAVLCVAASARAGWVEVTTATGTPTDLTVTDGGVLVLSTTGVGGVAQAWRVTDAGVSLVASVAGEAVGAGYFGADCLAVARAASRALAYSSPACGVATTWGTSGTTGLAFRMTPTITGAFTLTTFAQLYVAPGSEGPWSTVATNIFNPASPGVLQIARVGGIDVLAVNAGVQRVGFSIDGGAISIQAAGADLRDVAPFAGVAEPALLGVATDGGLLLSPGLATVAFQPVAMPPTAVARYVSQVGLRGLASTASGVVLSPIPDSARPGETWVERPGAPLLDGRVHCVDGRWCGGFAGNVAWALVNDAAPTVAAAAPPVRYGETVRLEADAGDADGDPVHVQWSTTLGTLTPVAGVPSGTQVDLVPNCEAVVPIDVTVTDGLRSSSLVVQVPVERRGTPVASGPVSLLAGGDAGRFLLAVDGGCLAPAAIAWSSPTGQGGATANFDWTPPTTECSAGGTLQRITATVTWPGGLGTSVASVDTLVLPWGAPEAPVFPAPARQRSGTSFEWAPVGASHACDGRPSFPGTELLWELDGGALATPTDGGLLVTAPSSCLASTERFVARRQVVGETAGRVSAPGTLVVELTPDLDPLDAGAAFSVSAGADGGVFEGQLGLSAPCLAQRVVEAEVVVSQGGAPLATGRFAVPGAWSLPVSGACLGGLFDVTATLFESGADTGARAGAQVTTGVVPVAIGALSPAELPVQCGVGGAGELVLAPVAGTCASAAIAWRQAGGPALEVTAGQGDRAVVQTVARDWSAAGQVLTLEWSSDAGAGNAVTERRDVSLTVAPFLSAATVLEPVLVREESWFRARVTLSNPTACGVDGVEVELPFDGATPLAGSVNLGGVAVDAGVVDGALTLGGVAIPAGGQIELTVLARPRLLGRPGAIAVARLNGQLVSVPAGAAAPSAGCGCGAAGDGGLLLALLAFSRWRRRAARVG